MKRKDLIRKCRDRANETYETCKTGSVSKDPQVHAALLETATLAKGRRDAFDAVLDAMNGNAVNLNFYAE